MARQGILTAGTWCVDRTKLVEFWPAENGFVEILKEGISGGGSGCNFALDVRKLDPGFPLSTISLVGEDADGRFLLDLAASNGIDNRRMATTNAASTQYTDVYTSKTTGKRTHIASLGTADLLSPDHFDFTRSTEKFLHLGILGVHALLDQPWQDEANGWVAVLKRARKAGLKANLELVSTDPARLSVVARPCLPFIEFLVVNDHEIGAIAGVETLKDGTTDVAACLEAVKRCLDMSSAQVVVTHFPGGAIAATGDGSVHQVPSVRIPNSEMVGANGAGDAFAAGFLYAMHEEWPVDQALKLAHATAATSLRDMSTSNAVEDWRTCLDLAGRWGWRQTLSEL
ncbi:MAG: carbohydrate kinase family protein [Pseudomonadota bacterium]